MSNLLNETEQRTVYLGRLASGLLKSKLVPTLEQAYKAARLILLDAGDNISITNRNKVTAAIRRAITEIDNEGWDSVTKEMEALAIYDAGYYAGLVGSAVSIKLNTPADDKITSYINKSIMSLTSGQKVDAGTWADFVKAGVNTHADLVDSIVKSGYANGQTVQQMVKQLRDLTDGLVKNQAESLVRTGVQHYSTNGREAMFIDNDVDEVVYVSVLDNRTSLLCMGRDGLRYKMDDPKRPPLPAHYNCLSEDTLVSTCSDVSNVYKRWYEGGMVNITTKSGRSIKITPNHPVLTRRGWIEAGLINLSDQVFSVKASGIILKEHYKNSTESKFCDLFSSLEILVDSSLVSNRPTATEDFHGDTTDSNVNVIDTSSLCWGNVVKSLTQEFKNKSLPAGSLVNMPLHGLSSEHLTFNGSLASSSGVMSSLGERSDLLGSGVSHSSELLLTPVSWCNPERLKDILCGSDWTAKAELFCQSIKPSPGVEGIKDCELLSFSELRLPSDTFGNKQPVNHGATRIRSGGYLEDSHISGEFEIDDVVDVVLIEYSGHVYNLENVDNWYLSNGIVTHNCRSTYIPAIAMQDVDTRAAVGGKEGKEAEKAYLAKKETLDQRRDQRAEERAEGIETPETPSKVRYLGRKDSNAFKAGQVKYTQYDDWLKSQPDWFIESTLGKGRAEIFKQGKLSLSQFTDLAGRPLTLAELRVLDGN